MDAITKKMATRNQMPGLLISVRDENEAKLVDEIGVDILDIKEPDHGALGRAKEDVIERIVSTIKSETTVSAAFGDLDQCEYFLRKSRIGKRISYAKCGLARAAFANWQSRIDSVWSQFRQAECEPVAVAYADHTLAFSPKPKDVLEWAIDKEIKFFLIDTFDKHQSNVFEFLSDKELEKCLSIARDNNIQTVLAGSIRPEQLQRAIQCSPDFVGVRGAVCSENRKGTIESKRVIEFKNALLAFQKPD